MKIVEKIICFFLASMLLLSLSALAYATNLDTGSYPDFFDAEELQDVQNAVFHTEILYENGVLSEAQTVGTKGQWKAAYKLFSLADVELISALRDGVELSQHISDDYVWVIVTAANEAIRVGRIDGAWDVLGYSTPASDAAAANLIQPEALNEELSALSASQGSVDNLICFEASMYHTNFAYISTEDGEFLIPYGNRPDLTGLENGKKYTPEEVGDILASSFGDMYSGDENGGMRSAATGWTPTMTISAAVILVAAVGIAFFQIRRRPAVH